MCSPGLGCPTAHPKPVSATLATYHPCHFALTAQEVVSTSGVLSKLFVVGHLLSRYFFAFLRSGEFTCPLSAAYDCSMLSWGDIQVDSHNRPSYLRIVVQHSKKNLFGSVPQVTPCAQSLQCCLTCRFSLTGQVLCSCIRMVAHCHGLIWWQ